MSEVRSAITRWNGGVVDTELLQRIGLESFNVGWNFFAGQGVPFQVQQRGGQVLKSVKSLIELAGFDDLVEQLFWNLFAGLVVFGIVRKDLRLNRPVLFKCRWELDEISWSRGAGDGRIRHVRKHAVQCVPHLVEQRRHIVKADQCGLPIRWAWNVQAIDDHRLFVK